ncbi:hypothetical protein DSAG12_02692 [Promethearchaeum syntrophicum]|uniref:Uncharacterized protein n=1 Tax=Promethearchaeum syntrophicum TaxID=2594042 RepID=A0A5B9DCM0_9ARCH|nr:hypothetical protein [Candidatus Prometheoarchaeum syntrophicum]QEE16862.1 hypothetical protein DSAG12_02692 [Candidatus Prometheoarchaeum syntrophicum]
MDSDQPSIKIKKYIRLYNNEFIRDKKDENNPIFLSYIIINFIPFPVICILALLFFLYREEFSLIIAEVIIVIIGLIVLISFLLTLWLSRKTFIKLYYLQTNFFERLRYEKIKFTLEKEKFSPKLEIEVDKYSISNPTVEFINHTKKMSEKMRKKTKIESSLCCIFFVALFIIGMLEGKIDYNIFFYLLLSFIVPIVFLAYLCISFQSVDYFLMAVLGADIERWHSIRLSDKWKNKANYTV